MLRKRKSPTKTRVAYHVASISIFRIADGVLTCNTPHSCALRLTSLQAEESAKGVSVGDLGWAKISDGKGSGRSSLVGILFSLNHTISYLDFGSVETYMSISDYIQKFGFWKHVRIQCLVFGSLSGEKPSASKPVATNIYRISHRTVWWPKYAKIHQNPKTLKVNESQTSNFWICLWYLQDLNCFSNSQLLF